MIGVERVEEYVFWAVTGAIGLLISALTFFVKRGMDKKDANIFLHSSHPNQKSRSLSVAAIVA